MGLPHLEQALIAIHGLLAPEPGIKDYTVNFIDLMHAIAVYVVFLIGSDPLLTLLFLSLFLSIFTLFSFLFYAH